MANYHSLKNAGLAKPAASTDLGSSSNKYGAGGHDGSAGFGGAARIIWGPNRAYPSTNTANV